MNIIYVIITHDGIHKISYVIMNYGKTKFIKVCNYSLFLFRTKYKRFVLFVATVATHSAVFVATLPVSQRFLVVFAILF